MSCCTEVIDLCEISSCTGWIKTDIAINALNPLIAFKATVKFNGVQLTCATSNQGGFLAIKNTLMPSYTYQLKVEKSTDETYLRCFRFKSIQNKNL